MAKRSRQRSEASDATATPTQPKARGQRTIGEPPGLSGPRPDTIDAGHSADPGDSASATMDDTARPTEEEIRLRAYHRYLERGGGHGMAFEDWLEAERELTSKK